MDKKLDMSPKQIRKEFADLLFNKKRTSFVAEDNGDLKGYIIGTLIKNAYQSFTYIDDIFVVKNLRKKNLGKSLIEKFKEWSKTKKVKRIRLGVGIGNKKAINLYKKIGFEIKHYEMEMEICP